MRIHKIAVFLLLCGCLLFLSHSAIFAQEAKVSKSEIYSKLKCCACNVSFAQCVCAEAKEMKAYIDALIETGLSKEEIFYKVAKKFSIKTILDEQIKAGVEKRLVKEMGEKRPQIILEPASFDFGRASKKQRRITKIFKLHNAGTTKLIITNVRVSCECVSVSLKVGKDKSPYFGVAGAKPGWQLVVEPKKSGELEVVLDLSHSSVPIGKVIRDIFVASNDPLYPESAIRVEAEITG